MGCPARANVVTSPAKTAANANAPGSGTPNSASSGWIDLDLRICDLGADIDRPRRGRGVARESEQLHPPRNDEGLASKGGPCGSVFPMADSQRAAPPRGDE